MTHDYQSSKARIKKAVATMVDKSGFGVRPWKRITFTRNLIEKILDGEVRCTYRKTSKLGKFLVLDSRFKPSRNAFCKIHCYRSVEVNPKSLTDKDAKLAGVESAKKLKELFADWYGSLPPIMYRNWFKVLDTKSEAE